MSEVALQPARGDSPPHPADPPPSRWKRLRLFFSDPAPRGLAQMRWWVLAGIVLFALTPSGAPPALRRMIAGATIYKGASGNWITSSSSGADEPLDFSTRYSATFAVEVRVSGFGAQALITMVDPSAAPLPDGLTQRDVNQAVADRLERSSVWESFPAFETLMIADLRSIDAIRFVRTHRGHWSLPFLSRLAQVTLLAAVAIGLLRAIERWRTLTRIERYGEMTCPRCRYPLLPDGSDPCPECGTDAHELARQARRRLRIEEGA